MIEMWADKAEPTVRLLVAQGGGLPAELGPRDWLLLGPHQPTPEERRQVERLGFCFIESQEPFDHPERLKDAGASGQ